MGVRQSQTWVPVLPFLKCVLGKSVSLNLSVHICKLDTAAFQGSSKPL